MVEPILESKARIAGILSRDRRLRRVVVGRNPDVRAKAVECRLQSVGATIVRPRSVDPMGHDIEIVTTG